MKQRMLYFMFVVEMSPNNNIITNPNQNWWWLTVSGKSVAANIFIQFTFIYEVCLKSIGTVCFAQTTLATVIKALFFKMAQCLVVVKM